MKKLIILTALSLLISTFFSKPCYAKCEIFISSTHRIVDEGDRFTLLINIQPECVSWSSDDAEVAEVSERGKVTAISHGVTMIRASVLNAELRCLVVVMEKEEELKTHLLSDRDFVVLFGERDFINITILDYELKDTELKAEVDGNISCSWGDNKQNSITLWIEPLDNEFATITITAIFIDGKSETIEIKVISAYDDVFLPFA